MRLLQKLTSDPNSADIFKEFDLDGDGTIDRGELRLGFKSAFGEVLTDADIDAIMAMADTDGDGSVEYGEFVQMGKVTQNLQLELNEFRGAVKTKLGDLQSAMEDKVQTSIDALSAELEATREQIKEEMAPRLADNAQSTLEAHARVEAAEGQLRLAEHTIEWLGSVAEHAEEAQHASAEAQAQAVQELAASLEAQLGSAAAGLTAELEAVAAAGRAEDARQAALIGTLDEALVAEKARMDSNVRAMRCLQVRCAS
jgi:predicted  nucleic acid-binding Zn-ribbon protein